jgi:hypothetical protein
MKKSLLYGTRRPGVFNMPQFPHHLFPLLFISIIMPRFSSFPPSCPRPELPHDPRLLGKIMIVALIFSQTEHAALRNKETSAYLTRLALLDTYIAPGSLRNVARKDVG